MQKIQLFKHISIEIIP